MNLLKILKQNKLVKNLSWILFGSIIHAILSFLLSIFAARSFSVNDYGILSYALSLTTLFSSFCTLGLSVIITKEIADDESSVGKTLSSGVLLRVLAGFITVAVLIAFLLIRNTDSTTFIIILIYSIGIVFAALDLFMYWFRYDYKADVAAILKLLAFLISALVKGFAIYSNSIVIFAIGAITETVLYGLFLVFKYLRDRGNDLQPSLQSGKRMLFTAAPFIFSSILVAVYSQTDKLMLEAFLGYESVALYSVSLTIANVIGVALSSLVEAYRPEILKARCSEHEKYEKLLMQLYGLTFWTSVIYGLFVTVFNSQIITLLYGEKYIEASGALALIVWYSSFSYFGAINNIYMVAEGKGKWVQLLTLSGVIANIALNYLLIPVLGVKGAALASLVTQIFSNSILPLLIPQIKNMTLLSLKGIIYTPKMIGDFRKK